MKNVTYQKDGILIDGEFIDLFEINKNCAIAKIKDEKLLLLRMKWDGWRGFDEGICEEILLPIEKIEIIKKYILGKTIYFGEISGKHSDIYNTLDENDIEIVDNLEDILFFFLTNPSQHKYNHSFLHEFCNCAYDDRYDDITKEEIEEFANAINDT